jgi:hypothetical protein
MHACSLLCEEQKPMRDATVNGPAIPDIWMRMATVIFCIDRAVECRDVRMAMGTAEVFRWSVHDGIVTKLFQERAQSIFLCEYDCGVHV